MKRGQADKGLGTKKEVPFFLPFPGMLGHKLSHWRGRQFLCGCHWGGWASEAHSLLELTGTWTTASTISSSLYRKLSPREGRSLAQGHVATVGSRRIKRDKKCFLVFFLTFKM